jgi:coenzyme F420-reducing hydrogenase delta subunit
VAKTTSRGTSRRRTSGAAATAKQPPRARPSAAALSEAPAPAAQRAGARIVVFSCQWAPHYAFQSLYRRGVRAEAGALRVLTACAGRVGEDLVLEAFRLGADGVALLTCPPELCRHGLDHARFRERLASLRAILETLGIPADRLLVESFHPHEAQRLAECLERFIAGVAAAAAVAAGAEPGR